VRRWLPWRNKEKCYRLGGSTCDEIYFETIKQESATQIFIWVLPLFAIKKLSFSFSPNQNQQIFPDKYFREGNSRNLIF